MGTLINDNFSTYPNGHFPGGAWQGSTGGNAKVDSFSPFAPFKSVVFNSGGVIFQETAASPPSHSTYCFFFVPQDTVPTSFIDFLYKDTAGGIGPLVQVFLGHDNTISIVSGGLLIDNSKQFAFTFNTWNFLQVNLTLDTIVITGINFIRVNTTVFLNGFKVIDTQKVTNFTVNDINGDSPATNRWEFNNPSLRIGWITECFVENPARDDVFYPHATGPEQLLRISQMVAETMEIPGSNNLRASQMAVELATSRTDENLRISQLVIELMTTGGSAVPDSKSGGWKVQEA